MTTAMHVDPLSAPAEALWSWIKSVRAALQRHLGEGGSADPPPPVDGDRVMELTTRLTLSPFERDLLVLCAATEIDPVTTELCARVHGAPIVTGELALAVLADGHWTALSSAGPLRRFQLLTTDGGGLVHGRLRIAEPVVLHLLGLTLPDPELPVHPVAPGPARTAARARLASELVRAWTDPSRPVLVQLVSERAGDCRDVVAAASAELGAVIHRVAAADLPTDPAEPAGWATRWNRQLALGQADVLLVEADETDRDEPGRRTALRRFIGSCAGPLVVAGPVQHGPFDVAALVRAVPSAEPPERRTAVSAAFGHLPDAVLDRLADTFDLDGSDLAAVCAALPAEPDARTVWDACRHQARPDIDDLAERVVRPVRLADVVLPAAERATLEAIVTHARHRAALRDRWGFGDRAEGRRTGVAALFSGPSGTGKTLAAQAVAGELGLDLWRVDLSQVISKWIGETEKNLRRVFAGAERSGAVLLFDEADALFGRRTQVRDSHDRYANVGVSYLLQRLETYRGVVLLTTNLPDAVDDAFLRRLRYVVTFPFPGEEDRAVLWRRAFPAATPLADVDPAVLARLPVTGATIDAIALHAAVAALAGGESVGMTHLLDAARREMAKLRRPLSEADVQDWR